MVIKNAGILIRTQCRKILAEHDASLYDITGYTNSISQMIYASSHVDEYESVIVNIICRTAEYVQRAVKKKNVLLYECKRYIESDFDKNVAIADIAQKIGTSPSYLSRIFKEDTGTTIIAAMNCRKIEKAEECLKNTDMKIYEIADMLGFENTTYFSHFFKKYTGVSPNDYKERKL